MHGQCLAQTLVTVSVVFFFRIENTDSVFTGMLGLVLKEGVLHEVNLKSYFAAAKGSADPRGGPVCRRTSGLPRQ